MYRLFDASGVLLYVGCTTVDLAKRLSAHHCQTLPWWSNVARTEQTQYERHEDALLAERRAIWHERPAGAQLDTQQGREHQARTME
jgi:hypothetical protein